MSARSDDAVPEGASLPRNSERRQLMGQAAKLAGSLTALGALPGLSACAGSVQPYAPLVDIDSGKLRGRHDAGVYSFKGVPYGAPTGGAARFLPPQPVAPWSGVREAFDYGSLAPQNDRPASHPFLAWIRDTRPYGEDCLVLNVFTPALRDNGKRPVMVYIHGGGFTSGAGSAPGVDGSNLVRRGDVVVVSLNHRLNLFGHLYLGHLDPRYADSGNAGMLDIIQALRWVQRNITAFGGDPANVTIFGQSGGASKVAVLMAMPEAKGLFHRAIVQSASSLLRMAPLEAAERNTHHFLSTLGLDGKTLGALHTLPADRLLRAMPAAVKAAGMVDNYRPVVDNRSLPVHPFDGAAAPAGAAVPLIIGWCETELRFTYALTPDVYAMTADQTRARVARLIGIEPDAAEQLIAVYRKTRPHESPGDLFALIHSDHQYRRNNTRAAELKSAQGGAPVYMYEFAWRTPVMNGILRTPHTLCIPFAFANCDVASGITGTGKDRYPLQDAASGAWLAFARHGDPNHDKLPGWRPFEAKTRATMVFDNPCRLVDDPARDERLAIAAQPAYEADAGFRR